MKLVLAVLCGLSLVAAPAFAQDKKQAACEKQAVDKGLIADGRRQFMATCLKGEAAAKGAPDAQKKQRERQAACEKQAIDKSLIGDGRRQFMASCLKG